MTPYDLDNSEDESASVEDEDVIFYENVESPSKMSQMKNSLNEINQRVIKKKTTPHI